MHTELVLASTYQYSWSGSGTRTANTLTTEYCDKQVATLATQYAYYEFTTSYGLVGTNKCTYIAIVSSSMGAPAFQLTWAAWTNFQFHYVEWTDGQVTYIPAANALPGWLGTYTASTYLSPVLKVSTSVFPSSGTDISWAAPTNWN